MTGPLIDAANKRVLIYTIHRVEPWFAHLGRNMGFGPSFTVSDHRGDGDYNTIERFYPRYRAWMSGSADTAPAFDEREIEDIIARCRLLRWLPAPKAKAMILAMADALEEILEAVRPDLIVSFPIDRYVSDVLARLGARRGIPFHEVTASAVPGMAMILHRGQLVKGGGEPDPNLVKRTVSELADPLFTPAYVRGQKPFDRLRWLRVFGYFRLRAWAFWLFKTIKRDPLSLHYMDSQSFLGHKPRLADIATLELIDSDWRARIERFPRERRLFIGLQLFPEASIDYWVAARNLVDYENMLVEAARIFSDAGYGILVKDHPLQFGFRQADLLRRLKAISGVIFVPYEVPGNEALGLCNVNFTLTGTLGMQAALAGKISIATPCYYTNPEDFIILEDRSGLSELPARVASAGPVDLAARQRRIISHLLSGSFPADFFSFKGFNPANPDPSVATTGASIGAFLKRISNVSTPPSPID